MKQTIAFVLSFVLTSLALAQDVATDRQPDHAVSMLKPIEINMIENGWSRSGGPYPDTTVIARLADIANGKYRIPLASSVKKILEEGANRDQAVSSKWVRKDSPRLTENTLVLGLLAWEVTTGGSSGGPQRNNYGYNQNSASTESAQVTAFISVTLRDLVSGLGLSTITGNGTGKVSNVTNVDISWFRRSGFSINMSSWNGDPSYRAALVAVKNALEDLRKKSSQLYTPEEDRH